jgi:glutathione S-transferase
MIVQARFARRDVKFQRALRIRRRRTRNREACMPIQPDADIEITAFEWVPPFAQGLVRDLRPRWACEELGLDYSERLISAMERPASYFEDQPWGQVPFLRDGDVRLFESGAMLIHLAEKAGAEEGNGLLPKDGPGRAAVLSWLFAALNSIEPHVFELTNIEVFSRNEQWAQMRRPSLLTALGKRLDRLEARMDAESWIAGDFSIADIAMTTVLRELGLRGLLADRPILSGYLDRATARPAFKTALEAQLAPFAANAPAKLAKA